MRVLLSFFWIFVAGLNMVNAMLWDNLLDRYDNPQPLKVCVLFKDPSDRRMVIYALMAWQKEVSNFTWEYADDPKQSIVFRDRAPNDAIRQISGGTAGNGSRWLANTFTLGDTKHNTVIINWFPDGNRYESMVHEIGHVLGVDHSDIVQSVMYPNQQEFVRQTILHSDLSQLPIAYKAREFNSDIEWQLPYEHDKRYFMLLNSPLTRSAYVRYYFLDGIKFYKFPASADH